MLRPTIQNLVTRLEACDASEFPGCADYLSRYRNVADYIRANVHPVVVAGATAASVATPAATPDDVTLLTDHGIAHINTVIERAGELVNLIDDDPQITGLEVYLLLMAIQLHDIGNAFGRVGHEYGAGNFLATSGLSLGDDAHEKRLIALVASAHGGKIDNDEDKISYLREADSIMGKKVRPRFLAAILRLADELADDKSRVSGFLMNSGAIPHSSEVYHEYASALNTPTVGSDHVSLQFEIPVEKAARTFGKGTAEVYLIDEIFERTLKMDRERMYCMRFLRGMIHINRIDVVIEIFRRPTDERPLLVLTYRIEEAGYPSHQDPKIVCICTPSQSNGNIDPNVLNGTSVAEYLRRQS